MPELVSIEEAVEAGFTPATIVDVAGTWQSGLASITLEIDDGGTEILWCENGPLIRALEDAFGDVEQDGHTFDPDAVKGRRIAFQTGMMGMMMERFVVLDQDPVPVHG